MSLNSALMPRSVHLVTWIAPSVAIPALRYLSDPRERRNELFLRDASTYAMGTVIYFTVGPLAKKFFQAVNLFKTDMQRNYIAFLLAITANILYAGIGAVKLSQHYARRILPQQRVFSDFNTTCPSPWQVSQPRNLVQTPGFSQFASLHSLPLRPSPRGVFEAMGILNHSQTLAKRHTGPA